MGRLDAEYLTVAEAAKALRLSQSTVWRWIDGGRLPAYRFGPRKIRVRSTEVAALISPARQSQQNESRVNSVVDDMKERLATPLTAEEKARALAIMDEIEALDREIRARHPGDEAPSSLDLLTEAREERTRELA